VHPIEELPHVGAAYSDEERDFLAACDRYRVEKHLPFLALTDVLYVLKQMGYIKREYAETIH